MSYSRVSLFVFFVALNATSSSYASNCVPSIASAADLPEPYIVASCLFQEVVTEIKKRPLNQWADELIQNRNADLSKLQIEIRNDFKETISENAEAFPGLQTIYDTKTLEIQKTGFDEPRIKVNRATLESFWILSQSLALDLSNGSWGSKMPTQFANSSTTYFQEINFRYNSEPSKRILALTVEYLNNLFNATGSESEKLTDTYQATYHQLLKQLPPLLNDRNLSTLKSDDLKRILNQAELIYRDSVSGVLAHEIGHAMSLPTKVIKVFNNERYIYEEWINPDSCAIQKEEIDADRLAYQILRKGLTAQKQMKGLLTAFLFLYSTSLRDESKPLFGCRSHPLLIGRVNLFFAMVERFNDQEALQEIDSQTYGHVSYLWPFHPKTIFTFPHSILKSNPLGWTNEKDFETVSDDKFIKTLRKLINMNLGSD